MAILVQFQEHASYLVRMQIGVRLLVLVMVFLIYPKFLKYLSQIKSNQIELK